MRICSSLVDDAILAFAACAARRAFTQMIQRPARAPATRMSLYLGNQLEQLESLPQCSPMTSCFSRRTSRR